MERILFLLGKGMLGGRQGDISTCGRCRWMVCFTFTAMQDGDIAGEWGSQCRRNRARCCAVNMDDIRGPWAPGRVSLKTNALNAPPVFCACRAIYLWYLFSCCRDSDAEIC